MSLKPRATQGAALEALLTQSARWHAKAGEATDDSQALLLQLPTSVDGWAGLVDLSNETLLRALAGQLSTYDGALALSRRLSEGKLQSDRGGTLGWNEGPQNGASHRHPSAFSLPLGAARLKHRLGFEPVPVPKGAPSVDELSQALASHGVSFVVRTSAEGTPEVELLPGQGTDLNRCAAAWARPEHGGFRLRIATSEAHGSPCVDVARGVIVLPAEVAQSGSFRSADALRLLSSARHAAPAAVAAGGPAATFRPSPFSAQAQLGPVGETFRFSEVPGGDAAMRWAAAALEAFLSTAQDKPSLPESALDLRAACAHTIHAADRQAQTCQRLVEALRNGTLETHWDDGRCTLVPRGGGDPLQLVLSVGDQPHDEATVRELLDWSHQAALEAGMKAKVVGELLTRLLEEGDGARRGVLLAGLQAVLSSHRAWWAPGQTALGRDDLHRRANRAMDSALSRMGYASSLLERREGAFERQRSGSRRLEAVALFCRLKNARLLGLNETWTTPLSSLQRTDLARQALPGQGPKQPRTLGEALEALLEEVDDGARLAIDPLHLQRLLPRGRLHAITEALTADLDATQLAHIAAKAGLPSSEREQVLRPEATSSWRAPLPFKAGSWTDVTLAKAVTWGLSVCILDDSTGRLPRPTAWVRFESRGVVYEAQYVDLPQALRDDIESTIATQRAVTKYMRGGDPLPFGTNELTSESTHFELVDGEHVGTFRLTSSPAAAVKDMFELNPQRYQMECATARAAMLVYRELMRARLTYGHESRLRFGSEDAAEFAFDTEFLTNRDLAEERRRYLRTFAASNLTWQAFQARFPPPSTGRFRLEIGGHLAQTPRGNLLNLDAVRNELSRTDREFCVGGPWYFANLGSSPRGVDIGYIGENTLLADLDHDGRPLYWGHPGGLKSQEEWIADLSRPELTVTQSTDFLQYFPSRQEVLESYLPQYESVSQSLSVSTLQATSPLEKRRAEYSQASLALLKKAQALLLAPGTFAAPTDQVKVALESVEKDVVNSRSYLPVVQAMAAGAVAELAQAFRDAPKSERGRFLRRAKESPPTTDVEAACLALCWAITNDGKREMVHFGLQNRLDPEDWRCGFAREVGRAFDRDEVDGPLTEGPFASRDALERWWSSDAVVAYRHSDAALTDELTEEGAAKAIAHFFPVLGAANAAYFTGAHATQPDVRKVSDELATFLLTGRTSGVVLKPS